MSIESKKEGNAKKMSSLSAKNDMGIADMAKKIISDYVKRK